MIGKKMIATQFLSQAPAARLRPSLAGEAARIEAVWAASQDQDDPAGRPLGGWWSVTTWATATRVLLDVCGVVGLTAIAYSPGAEAAEARVALLPSRREEALAERLIHATVKLAREAGAPLLRLYTPVSATWATAPARALGFSTSRELHVMLRPADAAPLTAAPVPGVRIRPLAEGEEPELLRFLNHAWAGTWNFRPITVEALRSDLEGQRPGMLVVVDATDPARIVGTCHAIFNPIQRNPDGQPYAWISNLTTDPAWRGRGLGRALLAAGLDHLRHQGARSVALGVDGGATVPLNLYRSAGFETISAVAIWERSPSMTGLWRVAPQGKR